MEKKVPALRFREFNCEWERKILKDIAKNITAKNKDTTIKNVFTNSAIKGIVNQRDFFDKDIANQNNLSGYYIVDYNDFIYNPRISSFAPVGPIRRNHIGKGIMSPLYTIFKIFEGNLDFFEIYFSTSKWHAYMDTIANYGARADRMNIKNDDFYSMPVPLPSVSEQAKIASFLTSIDRKIEMLEKQLELQERYKKGMMQKLFSQEIRFKDENGEEFPEWEEKRLGDVATIVMGSSPPSSSYNTIGIGLPLIQGNADILNRLTIIRNYTKITTKEAKYGDIIMSVRAPVGTVAKAQFQCCIGRGVCTIQNANEFIYQWLIHFESGWSKIQQGGIFDSINSDNIKTLSIPFPCKKEQQKIAGLLAKLDVKIEQSKKQIEAAKQWKKGLLQQMFV